MAFDGIVTMAAAKEMRPVIISGKIDKVYQPEADELVFNIHTKRGNVKLYASVNPAAARIHFIENSLQNPPAPLPFCMLLRKHIQGARVTDVAQVGSERIIEISLETLNELGFTVSKKLIFEIMGKHSNIVLLDISSGKIIDCIKHVSIDVNRVRQLLPGIIYKYPPAQDKIPFKELLPEGGPSVFLPPEAKAIQRTVGAFPPLLLRRWQRQKTLYPFSALRQGSSKKGVFALSSTAMTKDPQRNFILSLYQNTKMSVKRKNSIL